VTDSEDRTLTIVPLSIKVGTKATTHTMKWLLLGIKPNESSSWRAAWESLSAVQHCVYSCSNRVQVCVDAHAMAVHEVAGGGLEHSPFDSSRRTPPWRFTPERWMIGTESLR
jgi:hypothetical protein